MELDVNTSEAGVVDGVETVEVIAGGEDTVNLGSSSAAATLMDQHIAGVANPQEILVPTSEVYTMIIAVNFCPNTLSFSMQVGGLFAFNVVEVLIRNSLCCTC